MIYRYYLTYRPVDMGTCPRDFVNMRNYDDRTDIPELGIQAWGYAEYGRELTDDEVNGYQLTDARGEKSRWSLVSKDEEESVREMGKDELVSLWKEYKDDKDEYANQLRELMKDAMKKLRKKTS